MKTIALLCLASAAMLAAFAIGTFMNNEGAAAWWGLIFWLAPAVLCIYAPYHAKKQLQKEKLKQNKIRSAW
jgi:peptidoglycan/LPS O-acetylase OafA/YrhL